MPDIRSSQIGFIGLGQMGLGMAVNLLKAGFRLRGYDPRPEAMAALRSAGGEPAADNASLVQACDVVLTSLTCPVYLQVAREVLLPLARAGQVFIDTSTLPAPRAREMAAALEPRGAVGLDAPVTGGAAGAQTGRLRMFVGGDRRAFEHCLPMLRAVCKPDGVTYGGPAGMGQVMKVVQQLKNRLTDAVRLEVIAFGLRAGLSPDLVRRALDVKRGCDDRYETLLSAIEAGRGDTLDCVFAEWPYYLEEARAQGIPMPALEALYRFCKDGPKVCRDAVGRMAPSLWRELSTRARPAEGE